MNAVAETTNVDHFLCSPILSVHSSEEKSANSLGYKSHDKPEYLELIVLLFRDYELQNSHVLFAKHVHLGESSVETDYHRSRNGNELCNLRLHLEDNAHHSEFRQSDYNSLFHGL
jgi:hypothetical protein